MQTGDSLRQLWGYVAADICEVLPYIKYGLMIFGLTLFSFLILIQIAAPGRVRIRTAALTAMLAGYSVVVLCITFLSRHPGSRDGIDLLPFSTMGSSIRGDAWTVENILLFIPYGIILPGISSRFGQILPAAGFGLMVSAAIELCQFLTKRGHVQTDDLLTNVAGTLAGMLLYHILAAIGHAVKRRIYGKDEFGQQRKDI